MLDGAGSAGQPGWANRVSLPLQQTGATRTIVSNPRPIGPRLLCAYPFTPARQTLTHPAQRSAAQLEPWVGSAHHHRSAPALLRQAAQTQTQSECSSGARPPPARVTLP
jgi:hypothetical protein